MIQTSVEFFNLVSSLRKDYIFYKRKQGNENKVFLKGFGMQSTYVLSFGPKRQPGYQRRYS